ncbi:MAG: hypothetical protein D6675_07245 [Gemmatimonadetes bacterium]|nr:MAG: hypothetical protein D6675_07245 [Gemmatimonadota bacterium]
MQYQFPVPHPSRLAPDHPQFVEIMQRHEAACQQQQPTYPDPETGYPVMTAVFHLERGFCCGSGCRHCPYQKD